MSLVTKQRLEQRKKLCSIGGSHVSWVEVRQNVELKQGEELIQYILFVMRKSCGNIKWELSSDDEKEEDDDDTDQRKVKVVGVVSNLKQVQVKNESNIIDLCRCI